MSVDQPDTAVRLLQEWFRQWQIDDRFPSEPHGALHTRTDAWLISHGYPYKPHGARIPGVLVGNERERHLAEGARHLLVNLQDRLGSAADAAVLLMVHEALAGLLADLDTALAAYAEPEDE